MSRIQHAVILAAGRGTRMYPMTEVIPKPMVPFRGGTLISHGIRAIMRHGLRVHITVGYKRAALAQHVVELGVDSVINTEGHSNAWGLYHSLLSTLDEPLLVLTCDNVTEISVDRLAEDYFSLSAPASMVVPVKPVPGVDGDYIRHENQIVTSLSRTDVTEMYCSGIQVVNPTKIRQFAPEEGDFTKVWDQLISKQQLMASRVYPHEWMSIDTIDALVSAERGETPSPTATR
jgi:NDP-sugar pyrophosphorylase family protein